MGKKMRSNQSDGSWTITELPGAAVEWSLCFWSLCLWSLGMEELVKICQLASIIPKSGQGPISLALSLQSWTLMYQDSSNRALEISIRLLSINLGFGLCLLLPHLLNYSEKLHLACYPNIKPKVFTVAHDNNKFKPKPRWSPLCYSGL